MAEQAAATCRRMELIRCDGQTWYLQRGPREWPGRCPETAKWPADSSCPSPPHSSKTQTGSSLALQDGGENSQHGHTRGTADTGGTVSWTARDSTDTIVSKE